MDLLSTINFDPLHLAYPSPCRFFYVKGLSAMAQRLLASALWPVVVVMVTPGVIALHAMIMSRSRRDAQSANRLRQRVWLYTLNVALFVSYVVLPSVSGSIFQARKCVSFGFDDVTDTRRSYLVADLRVTCYDPDRKQDSETRHMTNESLDPYFWALFGLWPVAVPVAYFLLMLHVSDSVRSEQVTPMANAVRFLWRDYTNDCLFWEVLDTLRKLSLSSFIFFIQTNDGASKHLRPILAAFISVLNLTVLSLVRPFRDSDDLCLALVSNMFLACIFVSGSAIKICDEDDRCKTLVGFSDSKNLTVVIILISVGMLAITLLAIFVQILAAVTASTITVVSTAREPVMELPAHCRYHSFISHAWGTGQDQTHTIVRSLQLLLPDLHIWLDVDCLDDVSHLEQAVEQSAVFIAFLSAGYFRSSNCRRELYAALGSGKRIIAVHEADKAKGGATLAELVEECFAYCGTDEAGYPPAEVLERVLATEPITWVRVHDFQLESLRLIVLDILNGLPYYQRNPAELDGGIILPGQIGPFGFASRMSLLVCAANHGASSVAEELQAAAKENDKAARLEIQDAVSALDATVGGPRTMLLYLNADTFSPSSSVAGVVTRVLDARIPLVLVLEQDSDKGGCPFSHFFDMAPKALQLPPYRIFENVAVPLYSTAQHRRISLRVALRKMGARPVAPTPAAQLQFQQNLDAKPCRVPSGARSPRCAGATSSDVHLEVAAEEEPPIRRWSAAPQHSRRADLRAEPLRPSSRQKAQTREHQEIASDSSQDSFQ